MSVSANQQINHSIKLSVATTNDQQAVTPISVTARIDYILRFSKQAVLVVGDNASTYTQLARQYLATLSQPPSTQKLTTNTVQDENIAFVVASNQLNDIQMRCRLIEQLFANTLFDPEQSLAVSILRLVKQHNGVVTIVIEHAHALSLQLKYELCQLVDIANKTKIKINVVLFGQEHAAQEISQNRRIFDKKISIIDANSGQVIAIDHARFANSAPILTAKVLFRIGLITIMSVIVLFSSWFFLTEHENLTLTHLFPDKVMKHQVGKTEPQVQEMVTIPPNAHKALASTDDIYLALLDKTLPNPPPVEAKSAQRADILQALVLSEQKSIAPIKAEVSKKEIKNETDVTLPIVLNEQYYLDNKQGGYVIQIAGFSDLTVLANFIQEYKNLKYFSYQKSLHEQKFIVLTSQVFTNKAKAKAALSQLPKAIQQRGAFLKSVSIIKREINTVKG